MKERSAFWTAFGVGSAIAANNRDKKALRQVRDINERNRGIVRYDPSPVETLFTMDDPIGNVALSGGGQYWRVRAAARLCECAAAQGYSPIVLHGGSRALSAQLAQGFGGARIAEIADSNPVYDLFIGLSNAQIDRLIFEACPTGAQIKPVGKYYLDGVADFIRACGRAPAAYMFIGCPHQALIDQVNNAAANGTIAPKDTQRILSELLQGELERGSVEHFFLMLDRHAGRLLARKPNIASAYSMRSAVAEGRIFVADAVSDANAYLLNMLLAEAGELLSEGKKLLLVIDGISIAANDKLKAFVQASGASAPMVISADDVFASFGGSDADFFAFMGKAARAIVFRHTSAHSAERWADVIGSYDRLNISSTTASNANYLDHFSLGHTSSSTVSQKRERIVKPEELFRIGPSEAIVVSADTGEVASVRFV